MLLIDSTVDFHSSLEYHQYIILLFFSSEPITMFFLRLQISIRTAVNTINATVLQENLTQELLFHAWINGMGFT